MTISTSPAPITILDEFTHWATETESTIMSLGKFNSGNRVPLHPEDLRVLGQVEAQRLGITNEEGKSVLLQAEALRLGITYEELIHQFESGSKGTS